MLNLNGDAWFMAGADSDEGSDSNDDKNGRCASAT
jgi:hypothetical protein